MQKALFPLCPVMVAGHRLFVLQKALFSGCARGDIRPPGICFVKSSVSGRTRWIADRRVFVLQKQLFPWALGSIKAGRLFCGIGWSSNVCSMLGVTSYICTIILHFLGRGFKVMAGENARSGFSSMPTLGSDRVSGCGARFRRGDELAGAG